MAARYVFVDIEKVFEKDIVGPNSGRRVSKDGKTMCLVEDDLLRVGSNVEEVAEILGTKLVSQREALKIIQKNF